MTFKRRRTEDSGVNRHFNSCNLRPEPTMSSRGATENDSSSVGQVATELTFRRAFQFRQLCGVRRAPPNANSNRVSLSNWPSDWRPNGRRLSDQQQQMNTDSKTIG